MTDDEQERKRFAAALFAAGETLGEAISATRAEGYFTALRDLSLGAVEGAIAKAIVEWRSGGGRPNFPRPADLRDFALGTPEDRTALAWTRVMRALTAVGTYQSVDFGDPVLHATIEAMGGWAMMCRWERLDERELGYIRHEFLQTYAALQRRGVTQAPRYLVGEHEAVNRFTRGAWDRGLAHVDEILSLAVDGEVTGRRPVFAPMNAPKALPAGQVEG